MAEFCQNHPKLTVEYRTSQNVPDLLGKGIDVSLYLTESLTTQDLLLVKLGQYFHYFVHHRPI